MTTDQPNRALEALKPCRCGGVNILRHVTREHYSILRCETCGYSTNPHPNSELARMDWNKTRALASEETAKAGKSHRWNDDGEKCLDCGDSDWMNDPVCSPPQSGAVEKIEEKTAKYLQSGLDEFDGVEINPSNYNHEDVHNLNNGYIGLFQTIEEAIKQLRDQSRTETTGREGE